MSYEAGSRECKNLIESKEGLIKVMESISKVENTRHIHEQLKKIYCEIEEMHDTRKAIEKENP